VCVCGSLFLDLVVGTRVFDMVDFMIGCMGLLFLPSLLLLLWRIVISAEALEFIV